MRPDRAAPWRPRLGRGLAALPRGAEAVSVPFDPGWPHFARYTFSPAAWADDLLFVSGMTASDESGSVVCVGDMAGQARYIYEKLAELLAAAGGSLADVVMTRDYVTTTEGYRETAQVRRELFGGRFPAATGVVVAGLLRENALIEIEAVARIAQEA